MDVFIGNLTQSITFNDIRWLYGDWDFNAAIERVDGEDKTGRRYRYFLAHFSSGDEKDARRLIKRLNGVSYFGQTVKVREFIHRSYCNERRALNWRDKPWHGAERRCRERRGTEEKPH